ncbi:MAG: hypothetical protein ABIH38_05635 [Patescibacteria group bacterium]
MTFIVQSHFINDFNLGDNINHNFEILSLLYTQYDSENEFNKNLLRKLIILIIISIIEAVLYDFHTRIKNNVAEGVENLKTSVLEYVRGKKIDKFQKYIDSARKNNFFELSDSKFYDYLIRLCKLRNRVHIQNDQGTLEKKDRDVFTEKRMIIAEKALEFIFKKLLEKYSRDEFKRYVNYFKIPWEEHFIT